jgi:preprotein translocase subunit SecY
VYDARDTAENLKKAGAFIPGHPPRAADRRVPGQGADAADAVGRPVHHGGVPAAGNHPHGEPGIPFQFGGTSLLIIVVGVMDFVAQAYSHMMSHQYEGLMKKASLRGIGSKK